MREMCLSLLNINSEKLLNKLIIQITSNKYSNSNMHQVNQVLKKFDLFNGQPTLRARSHPEISNACGGILSIMVLCCFTYLFIAQFTQVIQWGAVSSIYTEGNVLSKQIIINQFPFGIGIVGFSINEILKYVRFEFWQVTMDGVNYANIRQLNQEPCKFSHFSILGDQAEAGFNKFNVSNNMCISPNQNLSITQSTNGSYKVLIVQISNCKRLNYDNSSVYDGCATDEQYIQNYEKMVKLYKYFTVTAIFVNTGFNTTNKLPSYKFMDAFRTTFTMTRGIQAYVFLSPYTINTDESVLPWENMQTQEGYVFDRKEQNSFQSTIYFESISLIVLISSKSKQFDRSIGKFDQVLSYAGGLFGIIISFLSFFLMSFNQYRYQLIVGEGAFNYSHQGHKMTESDFNFLQYLKFSLYDSIKVFTCHQMKWRNCKQVQETRQEANNQLDVKLLFRKIQHFEKVIEYLISDKENITIYLTEPPSLDEVKRERRIAEYYDKVIKGKVASTVEDFQNVENTYNYAILEGGGILVNNQQQSKTSIVLAGSNSKRKLYDKIDADRENILERILDNQVFKKQLDIDDVDLNEEEQELELEIAQAFFRMPQIPRKKIQQKIPIKILHRLKRKYQAFIQKVQIHIQI